MKKKMFKFLIVIFFVMFSVNFCFAASAWGDDLIKIIANITEKIFQLGGAFCLLMIVAGGIWYMLARDDPKQASAAKAIVVSALIGLIVILASVILMNTIIKLGA